MAEPLGEVDMLKASDDRNWGHVPQADDEAHVRLVEDAGSAIAPHTDALR